VTGKTLKTAERAIKSGHCTVGKIRHTYSNQVKQGSVIAQTPKPHKRLKHNAKVALTVSKGKHKAA
jgi:beta-lactam-binding protein with PASTA domain